MWWFNPEQTVWPDAPADTFLVNGHWNAEVMVMIPSLGIVAAWWGGASGDPDTFNQPMNSALAELTGSVIRTVPSVNLPAWLAAAALLGGLAGRSLRRLDG